ncbi:MAG: cell division protein FtsA [Thermotoga sp.]|mgnify:CR=1 FL=1|nr:MAG: cell division protein FtsA [Thermotoga sp.]
MRDPRRFVTVVDMGSETIRVMISHEKNGLIEISGYAERPSGGINKGAVRDILKAREAVEGTVTIAESMIGKRVFDTTYHVCLSSQEVDSHIVHGSVDIAQRPEGNSILEEDVNRALNAAVETLFLPSQEEGLNVNNTFVLHKLALGYKLDGRDVSTPLEMMADELTVDAVVITEDIGIIKGIKHLLEDVDIDVSSFIYQGIAAAESCANMTEKERGVAVVNLGGGVTDIVVYFNGVPIYVRSLPLGGSTITRDIAQVLGISYAEAERIKRENGFALPKALEENVDITVRKPDNITEINVSAKKLSYIIYARLKEILEYVRKELRRAEPFLRAHGETSIPGGIILTGGGTHLKGIEEIGEEVLRYPCRIGNYANSGNTILDGPEDVLSDPSFSTIMGGTIWTYRYSNLERNEQRSKAKKRSFFQKFIDYWKKFV